MNNSDINKFQFGLMKHTTSGPKRNWFGTCEGEKDCSAFNDLVEKGYALKRDAPSFWVDDWVFSLTENGIKALEANNE